MTPAPPAPRYPGPLASVRLLTNRIRDVAGTSDQGVANRIHLTLAKVIVGRVGQ